MAIALKLIFSKASLACLAKYFSEKFHPDWVSHHLQKGYQAQSHDTIISLSTIKSSFQS